MPRRQAQKTPDDRSLCPGNSTSRRFRKFDRFNVGEGIELYVSEIQLTLPVRAP
jgi:hypothetical protein